MYRREQYIRSLACVRQAMSVLWPRAQAATIANRMKGNIGLLVVPRLIFRTP